MFGCLIAATDPVSVIASFKEMKVEPRLSLLVEAESLLNDGTAAVGFTVLVVLASGSMVDPASVGALLLWKLLGGVLVGGGLAGGVLILAGRTEDHLVEITLTTIIAYGSFLIAERLGPPAYWRHSWPGWSSAISAKGATSPGTDARICSRSGSNAAFLANSIVFILIGLHEPIRHSAFSRGWPRSQSRSCCWPCRFGIPPLYGLLHVTSGGKSKLSAHFGMGWVARRTGTCSRNDPP